MHQTAEALVGGLDHIKASPKDGGTLEAIVIRPEPDKRQPLDSCRLEIAVGAEGDRWVKRFPAPPLVGSEDEQSQLTLMNARAADLIAGGRDRWELAGDQLYVDLDLSDENLRAGDQLAVGSAILEVTPKAHLGCRKFSARYGEAAFAFVNSPEGKRLHLRGIYVRVVQAGEVRIGDRIMKRAGPKI